MLLQLLNGGVTLLVVEVNIQFSTMIFLKQFGPYIFKNVSKLVLSVKSQLTTSSIAYVAERCGFLFLFQPCLQVHEHTRCLSPIFVW